VGDETRGERLIGEGKKVIEAGFDRVIVILKSEKDPVEPRLQPRV
jgi:hypothetical protein